MKPLRILLAAGIAWGEDGIVAIRDWRVRYGGSAWSSTRSGQVIADAAKQWGQNDDITVVTVRRAGA